MGRFLSGTAPVQRKIIDEKGGHTNLDDAKMLLLQKLDNRSVASSKASAMYYSADTYVLRTDGSYYNLDERGRSINQNYQLGVNYGEQKENALLHYYAFRQLLYDIVDKVNQKKTNIKKGQVEYYGIKKQKRFEEKSGIKYDEMLKDKKEAYAGITSKHGQHGTIAPQLIFDMLRGTLIWDDVSAVYYAVDEILKENAVLQLSDIEHRHKVGEENIASKYTGIYDEAKKWKVIRRKNRWMGKANPSGYRDMQVLVKADSGFIAEIQLNHEWMAYAKRRDHAIYDITRLGAGAKFSPDHKGKHKATTWRTSLVDYLRMVEKAVAFSALDPVSERGGEYEDNGTIKTQTGKAIYKKLYDLTKAENESKKVSFTQTELDLIKLMTNAVYENTAKLVDPNFPYGPIN